MTSVSPG